MTINCKGTLIDLSRPKIMGILNLTPDSFSDGGKYNRIDKALHQAEKMLSQGADFIDIGGQSTRPNADFLSADQELQRVLPVIEQLIIRFPEILISVDTFWSKVASKSIESGAAMVNDISAGEIDPNMLDTVALLKVPYVLMHMQGTPQTMQNNTNYNNLVLDIQLFFSKKIAHLKSLGINDIILDLGYGFSKTTEQSFVLLKNQKDFYFGEYPILTGISRKSMIYKTLKTTPTESVNGTTALHMLALQNGASILRVHDVRQAVECVRLYTAYIESSL